jgi:DNA-binding PadR family transcriptional regulator
MFQGREPRHRRDGWHGPHRAHRARGDEELFEGRPHERRERVERGAMRYVLLDALRDGPKHGYEIIKWLDERTKGAYAPSPGAVYPTLQLLGDLGLVRAGQDDDRRVHALTDAGRAALDEHAETIRHFWARFTETADASVARPEIGFVRDELDELAHTAWTGVRSVMRRGDYATIRDIRAAVERCKNEVREIIARGATVAAAAEESADRPAHSLTQ